MEKHRKYFVIVGRSAFKSVKERAKSGRKGKGNIKLWKVKGEKEIEEKRENENRKPDILSNEK